MKKFNHWKKYSLLCASSILLVSGSLVVYEIYQEYQSMQVLQIASFDSYWKNVFDDNSKLVKDLSDHQLAELKNLIKTPSDKSRYKLAEMSVFLKRLTTSNDGYEIDQILSIMSDYQLNRDIDKEFPEQRSKNLEILKSLETFANDLSESIHSLTVSDDQSQIIFDKTLTSHEDLQKIDTSIRWSQLEKYNSMIETLNSEIKSQILENEDYRKQKTIIDLKQNLDNFLNLIESTKEKLKTKYVTVKEVKKMINSVTSVKDSNADWFTDSTILDYRGVNETRSSTLSSKFYSDNDLRSLSSLSDLVVVEVSIKSERLNVRNKNEESKTSNIAVRSSADFSNLNDEDLIEIDSLKNLSFKVEVNQTEKIYKEVSSSSSSTVSSSDSDVRSNRSRTETSSERSR